LAGVCLAAIARHDKPDAVSERRDGQWVSISAADFVRRVRHIALGLADLGIRAKDRVALISENRPEWSIADLAILSLGAVTVPIYTTQSVEQIQFILEDSGTRALMISGGRVLKHARPGFAGVQKLEHLVIFDSKAAAGLDRATPLESVEARGAAIELADHGQDGSKIAEVDLVLACRGRTASDTDALQAYCTTGAGEHIDLVRKMRTVLETYMRVTYRANFDDDVALLDSMTNTPHGKLPYGPTGAGDDWVRIGPLETVMDGDLLTATAYLRTPWGIGPTYEIAEPSYRGDIKQDPYLLPQVFCEAVQRGWQLSAHCVGDAAMDFLVNSYEQVNFKTNITSRRFAISASTFQAPQNWDRWQKLGLVADMQPAWLFRDGLAFRKPSAKSV